MNLTESRALAARLASLLRQEHSAMADFLAALADFDQRRGWLELGYSGLFPFLHRELGLSKAAAFFRMTAATLIQRFPEIIEPLRDGRLCLTTMASLAKVLTPENRAEVLPRFFHRSKQEAAAIAAELCPVASPPSRTVVTTVPAPVASASQVGRAPSVGTDQVRPDEPRRPEGVSEAPSVAPALPAPDRPMAVEPLTASQVRLHLTVPPEFLEKLEAARLALSHSMPGASAVDVLSAGLDLLLQRDAKRKGLVESPRPAAGGAGRRRRPACSCRSSGPLLPRALIRTRSPSAPAGRCRSAPPGPFTGGIVATRGAELRSHGSRRPTESAAPPPRAPSMPSPVAYPVRPAGAFSLDAERIARELAWTVQVQADGCRAGGFQFCGSELRAGRKRP